MAAMDESDHGKLYPLLVLNSILLPLQGFFNVFIYVRPSWGSGGCCGGGGWFLLGFFWASDFHAIQIFDSLTIRLLNLLQLFNLLFSDDIEDGLEWLGLEHHILDEVNVEVVEVHLANRVGKLVLQLVNLVLQRPHLSDGFLHNLPEVGLVLCQGDQLGLHLCADSLNDSLDFFGKVEVEPEHLVEDESPLLQIQHDMVTHLVLLL